MKQVEKECPSYHLTQTPNVFYKKRNESEDFYSTFLLRSACGAFRLYSVDGVTDLESSSWHFRSAHFVLWLSIHNFLLCWCFSL